MAGKYSVPQEIRDMRPEGTTVKAISGHYYVYEQDSVKGKDGKWRTRSGKCIGKIDPDRGFVPNSSSVRRQEWRTLEFGQWAVADDLSKGTYSLLREFLNAEDADRVYVTALCHFVEGLTYMKDVAGLYDMSVLSLRYPGLRFSPGVMSRLYDDLGGGDGSVMELQRALANRCSGVVAIEGRVVGFGSRSDDLTSRDHEFSGLGEPQASLLMALDAVSGRPICSRLYEGRATDRLAVRDLLRQVPFSGVIFLVDRSHDGGDADLFTDGGNHYVFPLNSRDPRFAEAVADPELPGTFLWQQGGESTPIQYAERVVGGRRVIVYRNLLERGDRGYNEEKLAEQSPHMGVCVLQTSIPEAERDAQGVFTLYKERRAVETYFDHFRCSRDGHALCEQDHCHQQGIAFVMLVAGLIECEVRQAVEASGLGMSVTDVLMDARASKAGRLGDTWIINNCPHVREQRLAKLGVALEARPSRA